MPPVTYLVQNKNKVSINTLDAKALTFGMVAPKESSQTSIIQLFVPDVAAITNIRLALIDTGGIVFGPSTFGVDSRSFVDENVVPESFFLGVSDKSVNSIYNVPVTNLNRLSSEYIYININIPIGQDFIAGTIRYQWLFDFA